ncbi:MAG: hypothetical protein MZV63_43385 [Marinilabiliales bacterium]|nr:hypothetical protein [Marinilabiliales bacterium]
MNMRVGQFSEPRCPRASAADECAEGKHFEYFLVPALSGGAGTSINMNLNEIIANRALQMTGHKPGRL